jgi:hypothetical protein
MPSRADNHATGIVPANELLHKLDAITDNAFVLTAQVIGQFQDDKAN